MPSITRKMDEMLECFITGWSCALHGLSWIPGIGLPQHRDRVLGALEHKYMPARSNASKGRKGNTAMMIRDAP